MTRILWLVGGLILGAYFALDMSATRAQTSLATGVAAGERLWIVDLSSTVGERVVTLCEPDGCRVVARTPEPR